MKNDIGYRLKQCNITLNMLYERDYDELTRYLNPLQIDEMKKFLSYLPNLDLEVLAQPITRAILKVHLTIQPKFEWSDRWNGRNEPFWIIVDNQFEILHSEYFILHKKDV